MLQGGREQAVLLQLGALGPNHGNLGELEALEEEPVSEGSGWWPET